MKRGCPECEVSILYNEFLEELDGEFHDLAVKQEYCSEAEEYIWPWSRKKIIRDVAFISSLNAGFDGKGADPNWPITTKRLVDILREEINNSRRIDDANKDAETAAALRALGHG